MNKKRKSRREIKARNYLRNKLNAKGITKLYGHLIYRLKTVTLMAEFSKVYNVPNVDKKKIYSFCREQPDFHRYCFIAKKRTNINDKGYIYVVGNIEQGVAKIGYSKSPKQRIKEIQTGCPYELKMLAKYSGTRLIEKCLHEKYSEERLNGEWFQLSSRLISALKLETKLKIAV